MSDCVDLKQLYGDRYRITVDRESAAGPRDRDPWVLQLPGRYGLIYPYSATHLAVMVDHHPNVTAQLRALGLTCCQDGDRETTFLFTPEQFPAVAALVHPRRRPQLSPEERERLRAVGRNLQRNRHRWPTADGVTPLGRLRVTLDGEARRQRVANGLECEP
jgi:hypothetical protein